MTVHESNGVSIFVKLMRSLGRTSSCKCESSGILHHYFPVQSFIELGEVQ